MHRVVFCFLAVLAFTGCTRFYDGSMHNFKAKNPKDQLGNIQKGELVSLIEGLDEEIQGRIDEKIQSARKSSDPQGVSSPSKILAVPAPQDIQKRNSPLHLEAEVLTPRGQLVSLDKTLEELRKGTLGVPKLKVLLTILAQVLGERIKDAMNTSALHDQSVAVSPREVSGPNNMLNTTLKKVEGIQKKLAPYFSV